MNYQQIKGNDMSLVIDLATRKILSDESEAQKEEKERIHSALTSMIVALHALNDKKYNDILMDGQYHKILEIATIAEFIRERLLKELLKRETDS